LSDSREQQTPRSGAPNTGEPNTTSRDVPEEIAGMSGVQKVPTEWVLPTEEKWVRVSFVCKESEWFNYQRIAGNNVDRVIRQETGINPRSLQVERVHTR
jgi:hypothetical protein